MADPFSLFLMSLSSECRSLVVWELLGKPPNFHRRIREWKVRIMEGSPRGAVGCALHPVLGQWSVHHAPSHSRAVAPVQKESFLCAELEAEGGQGTMRVLRSKRHHPCVLINI